MVILTSALAVLMLGFGRDKVAADEAVHSYIAFAAELSDKSFKGWLTDVLQVLTDMHIPKEVMQPIIASRDVKMIHFSITIALDTLAINNCFDKNTAALLHGTLREQLKTCMGPEKSWLSRNVYHFINEMEDGLKNNVPPHITAAGILMNLLDFDEQASTRPLLHDPTFCLFLGSSMLSRQIGGWQRISKKFTIK